MTYQWMNQSQKKKDLRKLVVFGIKAIRPMAAILQNNNMSLEVY
jgi:hypothetical protein